MPGVSILMRTRDAGPRFEEVLSAVRSQDWHDYEIVVVDSGSRDGTVELAGSFGARIVHLEPREFTHARSMNLGFESSRGHLVVSLSQDATPVSGNWLGALVSAIQPGNVAAVFGRQVPRPGCFYVERSEIQRAYPESGDEPRTLFSNVNSITRRELWERRPFDESLRIAEDQDWVLWAQSQGFVIGYEPGAVVLHSHDYSVSQFFRRCHEEGRALAAFRGYRPGLRSILLGWPRQVAVDFDALLRSRNLTAWPRVCLFRLAQLTASYLGAKRVQ